MRTLLSRIIVSFGLLFGLSGAAMATLVYSINDPNAALTPYPGPYAQVSVTIVDATHANIVFTSLTGGGNLYLMGDGGSADLNVNGSYILGPVSLTPEFASATFVSNTPGNVSTFGVFNLSLNLFDGFTNTATEISFQLTNTSGVDWVEGSNDVLAANADGFFAAAHIFVCAEPCSSTAGALATGFAGNSEGGFPPVIIPEPQTLALLGLGLLVLGMARRRQAR